MIVYQLKICYNHAINIHSDNNLERKRDGQSHRKTKPWIGIW